MPTRTSRAPPWATLQRPLIKGGNGVTDPCQNYEGMDPESAYKAGRTLSWLKVKQREYRQSGARPAARLCADPPSAEPCLQPRRQRRDQSSISSAACRRPAPAEWCSTRRLTSSPRRTG